ncbi:MAG: hypothetical protein FWH43_06715 [Endomicrobia bacterium]|nr:hypothetical protein [Endomicrobiia bacterium]
MRKSFFAVFAVIISVFIAVSISARNRENKDAPAEQHIELAKITVTAPPLNRQESLERKTVGASKDKIKTAYFFSSSYKNIDYLVHYCEYKSEVNLQSGVDSLISKFKNNNLKYEVKEAGMDPYTGMLLEGSFEKDGKKFAIKDLLIKNKTGFWQIMSIYPYSKRNNKAAESFIKSVSFGSYADEK